MLQARGVGQLACHNWMVAAAIGVGDLLAGVTEIPSGISHLVRGQSEGWADVPPRSAGVFRRRPRAQAVVAAGRPTGRHLPTAAEMLANPHLANLAGAAVLAWDPGNRALPCRRPRNRVTARGRGSPLGPTR